MADPHRDIARSRPRIGRRREDSPRLDRSTPLHTHTRARALLAAEAALTERKERKEYLYSAIYTTRSLKALRHTSSSFTSKLHHACRRSPDGATPN